MDVSDIRRSAHPEGIFKKRLCASDLGGAAYSRRLNALTNPVTGIVDGERSSTCDTVLWLAHFFHTSPGIQIRAANEV